jgi:hypothetical protein
MQLGNAGEAEACAIPHASGSATVAPEYSWKTAILMLAFEV